MRHALTVRRVAVAIIGILAVAAFLRCYGFLASIMPYTTKITATIFVLLAVLAFFCAFRAVTRWKTFGPWRRVSAVVTTGASSALLVAFIVMLAQDPMYAPGQLWAIWNIQRLGGAVQIEELRGGSVWVSLGEPQVTDVDLAYLQRLPKLHSLRLMGSNISDVGLTHLTGAKRLRFLDLAFTKVTDAGLAHLKGSHELRSLNLERTMITDAGMKYLQGLTELEQLHLDFTKVTDAGLEHLKGLTKLQALSLKATAVTDHGLVHLKGMTKLDWLDVGDTKVTRAGLERLKEVTKGNFSTDQPGTVRWSAAASPSP